MKIGIIVDGDAESQALFNLTQNISISGVQILRPIYTDIQPKASAEQIAKKALDRINFLLSKGADRIIVLIDREDAQDCPTDLKNGLECGFVKIGCGEISVVIKNRKFENWLVSDLDALRQMPRRFSLSKAFQNAINPNKADQIVDAEHLLNTIVTSRGPQYHKRKDAQNITAKQNPLRIACNSRSFRRFLHLLAHPKYSNQSKKPDNDCPKR